MAKTERWEDTYFDRRDWHTYDLNLVKHWEQDIFQFGGDGSYDEIALWNQLAYNRIEPIIKPDKNAVVPLGSRKRDKNVEEGNLLGYDLWAREHGSGYRWPREHGSGYRWPREQGIELHSIWLSLASNRRNI